jgi:hypothetical protein
MLANIVHATDAQRTRRGESPNFRNLQSEFISLCVSVVKSLPYEHSERVKGAVVAPNLVSSLVLMSTNVPEPVSLGNTSLRKLEMSSVKAQVFDRIRIS